MTKNCLGENFLNRMKKLLGNDYEAFYNELSHGVPSRAMFVNTEKISVQEFKGIFKESLCAVPFCENGFYFEAQGIGNSALHHAGAFYVQDPSAMSTVCSTIINKGDKILDMCASPGGKTILAALKTGSSGLVVSNEYSVQRCKTLVGNIERFGLSNVICVNSDAADDTFLSDRYEEKFDLVIADAPCSGEGMFRKYPEQAISEWSEENIKLCALRQAKILDNAAQCVRNGGKLLYSTCTFSLEENEMTIDAFLLRHPEFSLIPVTDTVYSITANAYAFSGCNTENIHLARRFYPHLSNGEGQFIALMQKHEEESSINNRRKTTGKSSMQNISKEEKQALDKLFKCLDKAPDFDNISKYADNLIYCENSCFIPDKHVFSCGVKIGEFTKNYIAPHHSFFKCFAQSFKNKLELSENENLLKKYLHGESIEANIDDGWCVVTYNGVPLGGGKAVSGTVKNHYPKGLRTN